MNREEEEIIRNLKHNWAILSITSHAKGYWDFEDGSFDLRGLRGIKELEEKDTGIYLIMKDGEAFICIAAGESYYHIEHLNTTELRLTCYFKNHLMQGYIKLATFELRRE